MVLQKSFVVGDVFLVRHPANSCTVPMFCRTGVPDPPSVTSFSGHVENDVEVNVSKYDLMQAVVTFSFGYASGTE